MVEKYNRIREHTSMKKTVGTILIEFGIMHCNKIICNSVKWNSEKISLRHLFTFRRNSPINTSEKTT